MGKWEIWRLLSTQLLMRQLSISVDAIVVHVKVIFLKQGKSYGFQRQGKGQGPSTFLNMPTVMISFSTPNSTAMHNLATDHFSVCAPYLEN